MLNDMETEWILTGVLVEKKNSCPARCTDLRVQKDTASRRGSGRARTHGLGVKWPGSDSHTYPCPHFERTELRGNMRETSWRLVYICCNGIWNQKETLWSLNRNEDGTYTFLPNVLKVTLPGEQNPENPMGEAYRFLSDTYLRSAEREKKLPQR